MDEKPKKTVRGKNVMIPARAHDTLLALISRYPYGRLDLGEVVTYLIYFADGVAMQELAEMIATGKRREDAQINPASSPKASAQTDRAGELANLILKAHEDAGKGAPPPPVEPPASHRGRAGADQTKGKSDRRN